MHYDAHMHNKYKNMNLSHSPPGARMASAPLTKFENVTKNWIIRHKIRIKHYLPVMMVIRALADSLSIASSAPLVTSDWR